MVTVSILGAGFMGGAHAANYQALGDRVRVKTVCARSADRAAKVAATVGAEPSTDLDATIADPEIDAVDVCLPTPLHRAITVQALDAGKHVFLEKPIALTMADADAVVDAAARSGQILMVGLVLRFWPEYVELQRRLAAGELGGLCAVATHRLSPPADWADWFADRTQSGGTPVDLLVHDFDQMNWLLGRPRRVFAREPTPGHVQAVVEYDGATGIAEGSMAMPRSYPFSSSIRVLGSEGVAEYAFSAAPAEDGGNIGASDSARGLRLYLSGGATVHVAVESADPWGPEIAYFVDCVEHGRPPEQGTGEQARDALAVSLAVNRSLESGRPEAV
ncbi:MAG: Gfo/Idh/MocA family oxidoreductase [Actinobacteria bacterium]|nr:MAG: Gfo/Idh/MocA family oxidoreductase [Actinomycetota bacterium]